MSSNNKNNSAYIFYTVILVIIARFVLTGIIPLLDKTESRYAEIARIMHETNQWVVPQIDYGVPFWAKPPLSTWLSAASYQLFGVNEIAARLPYFLICLFLVIMITKWVKKLNIDFYLPAFILLTTPEFLLHAGVVSTDTALCFSITLIMLSFWKSIQNETSSYWNYLFFIGLGLGLLSKGPLVIVLTGPPIFIWLIIHRIKIKDLWSRLPWISGTIITALISIPWYLMAENKTPGFIDYFIVGEHFKRFLVSGWEGDLYGSGHRQPLGMIWVFLLLFAFPWIQIVIIKLWKERKHIFKHKWVSFLLLWLLWTPFFFTASKNILHTYTLPVTIPIALLVIHYWNDLKRKKLILTLGSIFPVLVIVATLVFPIIQNSISPTLNTDKYVIDNLNPDDLYLGTPIYYWHSKSHSGQFYTKGKAKAIEKNQLDSIFKNDESFIMMVKNKRLKQIPNIYLEKMVRIDSSKKTSVFKYKK